MKFKYALKYSALLLLFAAVAGGMSGLGLVFKALFEIFVLIVMFAGFLFAIDIWSETKELSLKQIWACRSYMPDMKSLWSFADKASVFDYYPAEREYSEKQKEHPVQRLAREIRDMLESFARREGELSYNLKIKFYFYSIL
jgi:hypothetical protein